MGRYEGIIKAIFSENQTLVYTKELIITLDLILGIKGHETGTTTTIGKAVYWGGSKVKF